MSRASWPVEAHSLADADRAAVMGGTAVERIAAVWELTVQAWELSGRDIPAYSRAETPVAVVVRAFSGAGEARE